MTYRPIEGLIPPINLESIRTTIEDILRVNQAENAATCADILFRTVKKAILLSSLPSPSENYSVFETLQNLLTKLTPPNNRTLEIIAELKKITEIELGKEIPNIIKDRIIKVVEDNQKPKKISHQALSRVATIQHTGDQYSIILKDSGIRFVLKYSETTKVVELKIPAERTHFFHYQNMPLPIEIAKIILNILEQIPSLNNRSQLTDSGAEADQQTEEFGYYQALLQTINIYFNNLIKSVTFSFLDPYHKDTEYGIDGTNNSSSSVIKIYKHQYINNQQIQISYFQITRYHNQQINIQYSSNQQTPTSVNIPNGITSLSDLDSGQIEALDAGAFDILDPVIGLGGRILMASNPLLA